jgi:hypothetical protein
MHARAKMAMHQLATLLHAMQPDITLAVGEMESAVAHGWGRAGGLQEAQSRQWGMCGHG